MIQEVIFKLNEEDYGFDIMNVSEIIRMQEITAMPNTASHILGVTNIRGKVIPIISLKNLLNIKNKDEDESIRIIVVSIDDRMVGFKVDAVSEIVKIEDEQIEKHDQVGGVDSKNYIYGIAKLDNRLVKMLDLQKILE